MKNGIFLTNVNVYEKDSLAHGIHKKILSQVEIFNIKNSMSCKLYIVPTFKSNYRILRFFLVFLNDIYYNKLYDRLSSHDFIYIRSIRPVTYNFIRVLKMIKKHNPNIKIVLEMPTFPYEGEYKALHEKCYLFVDKIFRDKLKKYVDRIATYSSHNVILGVQTIKITNGIVCANIDVRKPRESTQEINLIAVAIYHDWHAYDRLIEGLKNYYEQERALRVNLYFVGDGPKLNLYRNLVVKYKLSEYVNFSGILQGESLTDVYNMADIAISSLGAHRVNLYSISALKTREYLARGMPMVSSTKIDILPDNFKYCLYIPEDDSPINIQMIVQYYNRLLVENNIFEMTNEIRYFAESHCDMSITMKPIINYLDLKA